MGYSKPWPQVIKILTGGKTSEIDPQPLIEYFKPLLHWLTNENKAEIIGWSRSNEDIGKKYKFLQRTIKYNYPVCLFILQHYLNHYQKPEINIQPTNV